MRDDNAFPPFIVPEAPRTVRGSYLVQGGTWSPGFALRTNLPRELKAAVWNMTWGHCFYCGTNYMNPFENMIIEHVVPLFRGGTNEIENLVPACDGCNEAKGTLLLNEWRIARPYGDDPDEYPWLSEILDEHGNVTPYVGVSKRLTHLFFFERDSVFAHMRQDEIKHYNSALARRRRGER